MIKGDLTQLTAIQAVQAIRDGTLYSEALVSACLDRIETTEPVLRAWAHLDGEAALVQAREADRIRKAGKATGRLHGVPVGLKDIIDTADMPTERGTRVFAGRTPEMDATLVERLREAGAVIMGKTKTTELAFVNPTDTTNPFDPLRTPGGSSSGSAAAVAAHHVPLAVGSQTNGSVIRPASYCGVYGFKPTRGAISRHGVLATSRSLDQMGSFARSLEDVALLAEVMSSYDSRDSHSFSRPRPRLLDGARAEAPVEPDFAWFDLPYHDRLAEDAREGLEAVVTELGGHVERFGTAPQMAGLVEVQATIHEYEYCQHLAWVIDRHFDKLSPNLRTVITRGQKITRVEYEDAMAVKQSAESFFAKLFIDFDAILAPSAAGEAPLIAQGGTGDPVFCTIWTLAGLPALTLPVLVGEHDLPIGLQMIGSAEGDDRLLRTASWVQSKLAEAPQDD